MTICSPTIFLGQSSKYFMLMSYHRNVIYITGPVRGEFTNNRPILPIWASNVELWCFYWCYFEQTVELPLIREAKRLIWHHCNVSQNICGKQQNAPIWLSERNDYNTDKVRKMYTVALQFIMLALYLHWYVATQYNSWHKDFSRMKSLS